MRVIFAIKGLLLIACVCVLSWRIGYQQGRVQYREHCDAMRKIDGAWEQTARDWQAMAGKWQESAEMCGQALRKTADDLRRITR